MDLTDFQTQPIKDNRIPWVIAAIFRERKSGVLHIMGSNKKFGRRIYFDNGEIRFAISNQESDRFGRILLEMGVINQNQFTKTMLKMDGKKRFGQLLVEQEFITTEKLQDCVDQQALDIIYSTFELDSGLYFFEDKAINLPDDLQRKLDFATVILEGVRTMRNLILLNDELDRFADQKISMLTTPLVELQSLPLTPEEAYALSRIDGSTDMKQLVTIVRMPEDQFLKFLYGMLCLEVVGVEKIQQNMINRFERRDATSLDDEELPQASIANLSRSQIAQRETIIGKYVAIQKESLWEFLGIKSSYSNEQIRESFIELNKTFHPDLCRQDHLRDLTPYLNRIVSHLNNAYNTISDPKKRQVYLAEMRARRTEDQQTDAERERAAMEPYKIGMRYLHQEDLFNAHRYLEQAVKLNPNEPKYLLKLGELESRNPNWSQKARSKFIKVLEMDPTNGPAHFGLAKLYLADERRSPAINHLRQTLEYDPANFEAGELLESLQDQGSSGSFFDRLMKKKK